MTQLPELGPLLQADDFAAYVGRDFRVETKTEPVAIRLDEIVRRPGEPWMLREPFILVFSSPWIVLLVEGNYLMQPEGGAPVRLHLIPTLTVSPERRLYQAIFN
jgi:hypothetical protein